MHALSTCPRADIVRYTHSFIERKTVQRVVHLYPIPRLPEPPIFHMLSHDLLSVGLAI